MTTLEEIVKSLATSSVARFRQNPKIGLPKAVIEELGEDRAHLFHSVLAECQRRSRMKRQAMRERKSCPVIAMITRPTLLDGNKKQEETPFLPGMEQPKKYRH